MSNIISEPRVQSLDMRYDHRGDLTELIHEYDLPGADDTTPGRFGQTYIVKSSIPLTIRAFHRHRRLWDYFTVVHGRARIWIVEGGSFEPNALPTLEQPAVYQYILDGGNLARLTIPPGYWHGWQSLEPNTIMVCTGSDVYNRNKPDEERVEYNIFEEFGVFWNIKPS